MAVSAPDLTVANFTKDRGKTEPFFDHLHDVFALGETWRVIEVENADIACSTIHAGMITQVLGKEVLHLAPTAGRPLDDDADVILTMSRVIAARRLAVAVPADFLQAVRTPPLLVELGHRLDDTTRPACLRGARGEVTDPRRLRRWHLSGVKSHADCLQRASDIRTQCPHRGSNPGPTD